MSYAYPSLRTMRMNVWAACLAATDAEIAEGMRFYDGAHGLCRAFAAVHRTTPSTVAGIYAALSPMNGWEENVANTLDVLRLGAAARVNTPEPNRVKAVRIAKGEDPLVVLGGRKVRAFYRGIVDPADREPIPIDRHLICLAIGDKLTKSKLSRAISDRAFYARVESVYADLGRREGIGNRLAMIAWFVQRRFAGAGGTRIAGQAPLLPTDSRAVCCGRACQSQGARRYLCGVCGRSRLKIVPLPPPRHPLDEELLLDDEDRWALLPPGTRVSWLAAERGKPLRPAVYVGKGHPYANRAGMQYLARLVMMHAMGERLLSSEHVHHSNGVVADCRRDNLEVWIAEEHGRFHARQQLAYMLRDRVSGRFLASDVPMFAQQLDDATRLAQWSAENPDVPF